MSSRSAKVSSRYVVGEFEVRASKNCVCLEPINGFLFSSS